MLESPNSSHHSHSSDENGMILVFGLWRRKEKPFASQIEEIAVQLKIGLT
jgi:hypothetical protein